MTMEEYSWELFCNSGNPDAFVLMRKLSEIADNANIRAGIENEGIDGTGKDKRHCDSRIGCQ